MDIDLLRDGEHFSTFESVNFLDQYPDELTNLELQNDYEWSLESEQEINGDIALLPVCDTNITQINESPPNIDDFHKIINDWQQFINIDPSTEFTIEDPITLPKNNIPDIKTECVDFENPSDFDLTEYLNDIDTKPQILSRKCKAGVKRIDLQAQRYIIDEEDDVDIETVSECEENSPVLEAKDLASLLEQFEATQIPELTENCNLIEKNVSTPIFEDVNVKIDPDIKLEQIESDKITIENGTLIKQEIFNDHEEQVSKINESKIKNIKVETVERHKEKSDPILESNTSVSQKEPPKEAKKDNPQPTTKRKLLDDNKKDSPTTSKCSNSDNLPVLLARKHNLPQKSNQLPFNRPLTPPESITSVTPNKQIIDSLPQELIARIKESGKRKPISVIPPIPNKKRGLSRSQDATSQGPKNKVIKLAEPETIHNDHDYCSSNGEMYPKHPKKDSGFESAEEDDRNIIAKQPTVKNADGKLMVSLLKVNTIHVPKVIQKKKLNLEEYKKRREGFLKSQDNSQNSSPINSNCNSPTPLDENTKLLKHQEKLRRMAKEVLNTPPKGERKAEEAPVIITPPLPLQLPPDIEMKTLVSVGVNTEFKVRRKNIDPLAPVERLDEIKPLLQKASDKISGNSLITSVIETIPKIIESCEPKQLSNSSPKDKNTEQSDKEHGEDKTIVYLPKNRKAVQTKSIECQTNISLIQQTKASRYRRRKESSDSSSSESSRASRSRSPSRNSRDKKSIDSRCSSRSSRSSRSSKSNRSTSSYSSRSSSRSRSRSTSPRRRSRNEKERLREVEERRVIYVGRVPPRTTREDLRKRFQKFGEISSVSLHSRDHSYLDNYGFVTFANKLDAYEAIEHGNDDPWLPKFDLSFGGRRIFCQTTYSDLDNVRDECGYFTTRSPDTEDSFDKLLREAQEKLRKRKA